MVGARAQKASLAGLVGLRGELSRFELGEVPADVHRRRQRELEVFQAEFRRRLALLEKAQFEARPEEVEREVAAKMQTAAVARSFLWNLSHFLSGTAEVEAEHGELTESVQDLVRYLDEVALPVLAAGDSVAVNAGSSGTEGQQ